MITAISSSFRSLPFVHPFISITNWCVRAGPRDLIFTPIWLKMNHLGQANARAALGASTTIVSYQSARIWLAGWYGYRLVVTAFHHCICCCCHCIAIRAHLLFIYAGIYRFDTHNFVLILFHCIRNKWRAY